MSDLRSRLPGQSVIQRTLDLHPDPSQPPTGDALSWYKGALGEIAVAGILAELGPKWTVLHSVPVGRGDGDIDHVVIGPPGVFTLNTKSHPGQEVWMAGHGLLVSGRRTNYIGIAAAEAFRAEALLSSAAGLTVPVVPMVVLVNPGKRTIRAELDDGVRVVADWELLAELQLARREFSDEQVERIVAAAVEPTTWRADPLPEVDPEDLALRFNAMVARSAQLSVASSTPPAPPVVAPATVQIAAPDQPLAPTPVPPPAPRAEYARARRAPRAHQTRPARTSIEPQQRRRRKSTNTVGRLIGAGILIWVVYAGILPAALASLTP